MLPPTDFDAIYRTYAPRVWRWARRIVPTEDDAWDVVQTVFSSAALDDRRPLPAAEWPPYLYTLTRRHALNVLRYRAVRVRPDVLGALRVATPPDHSEEARLECRNLLLALGRSFDARDKEIFQAYYLEGQGQDEIATRLGIWRRTVGRRLREIETRLLVLLADREGTDAF